MDSRENSGSEGSTVLDMHQCRALFLNPFLQSRGQRSMKAVKISSSLEGRIGPGVVKVGLVFLRKGIGPLIQGKEAILMTQGLHLRQKLLEIGSCAAMDVRGIVQVEDTHR